MLSKNNYKNELKKMEPRNDHFSIRKLTVGTVSVLLGWTLINWGDTPVKADTTNPKLDKNPEVETDPNAVNESSSQIKKVKVEVGASKSITDNEVKLEKHNSSPQTNQTVSQAESAQKGTNSQQKQSIATANTTLKKQSANSNTLQSTKQDNNTQTQIVSKSTQTTSTQVKSNINQAKQDNQTAEADLIRQAKINTTNKVQTNNDLQTKATQTAISQSALAGRNKSNLSENQLATHPVTQNKIDNNIQATETPVDLKDVTPNFNLTNEAERYNLGVTIQQGQIIYAQVYIKNQNQFITWTTDKDDPGKNLYYYTTTGSTQGGQVVPNNATTTLAATLNNSGNYMKGTLDTASAGTISNSLYKGGEYNFSLSTKNNGKYYQTIITSANSESPLSNGNSGSVSWGGNSPIAWKFRAGFGDQPMPNQDAPTWQSTASGVPNNVSEKIYYINADTGAVLGEKDSQAALAGTYYDVTNADPQTLSVNGQNYQLVSADTVSAEVKNRQVTTVDGTPILISDLIDGQTNSQGQLSMYNKGDVLMTLLSAGPDYKLFVRKMLDNAGTAEYNTYTVDRSDVTPGAFNVSLDPVLSKASVKKDGIFSGNGIQEQNVAADGNSGLVFFYRPEALTTTGKVTYYDETTKKVLSTHDLSGDVGDQIDYTTTDTITQYENQGYKFVNSTFNNGKEIFQKDPSDNDFIVNFVHDTQTVIPENPGTPGQPINPNDPDGPKWPDSAGKDALEMTGSQTIRYEGAGDKTPEPNTQNTTFTKSETVDKVTGDVISSTDWTPSEHTFGTVKTPVVEGYHADQAQAGGFTSTPQDPKKTIVVTYTPNGKIIPVTPDGNPIPNVPNPPYTTNPDNPTSVNPNEPVPEIPGYTPEKNTVTPENPGTDTKVIYTPIPETGSLTVTYHDDTTNTTIPDVGYQSGEKDVGTAISYNPDTTIKDLENKGYKLVPGQDLNIPKEITKGPQNIVIHLVHGTQTVTPENPGTPGQPINPNDPNGPKWPESSGKDALEMTGTQTIRYEGAGDKTPSPNTQTTTFTKTETIDKVTGDVISSTDWTPSEHTFGTVKTPVVEGYHADQAEAAGFTSTPQNPNKTIVITYAPNGKIIPVDKDGNPIPHAPTPPFPTNPDNPTTTTDGKIPSVPGYTPESGQPGDPVKPGTNPSDDVKVPYVKTPEVVATTGKVTYYDETDKKVLSTHNLEGNVGEKITYTTTDMITQYENQGYKFVDSSFKNGEETFQKDPSDNDFIVNFVHATQTVTPENPGTPGQPINPNDPNGPKWPDSAGKDALEMTGTQTIRYEGAGDKTPSPNSQDTKFTKSETIDKVTGDVISSTDWTPSEHTFGTVKTPIVEGYHADQAEAGGFKATPQNPNKTIVVTYSPNGKIIPVDKDGNPIPNAPTPQFPTNPDNPTTTIDGKIPSVPGYTPESGQPGDPVKPGTNPSDDVKVPYVKNPTVVATTGTVTYYDETDKKVLSTHDLEGNVGEKITYTTTDMITQYENQGYKFVDSTFKNGEETYQQDPSDNDFIVNFVHATQTVTPENPGTPGQPINPNDPNGPKWPESSGKDALEMTGNQTIRYEGAGDKTPSPNTQNTTFTKSETIDKVTGDVISSTNWTPSEHTFGTVKTPVVEGYHADQAQAGGFTSTPQNPNKTIVVTYSPNGKIIPVTPDGNPIPNVPNPPYTTDPNNPTTVNPNEPVPEIPGYTPEKNTVTPENPGTDTPVVYHKNETPTPDTGSVTVTYHDDTTNTTIPGVGYQTGEKDVGTAVDYNPDTTIKDLENKGYQLVPGQDTNIPKEITKGAQNIVIHLVHGTQTVTPENPGTPGQPINPNDPNGPKWPESTGKDALEMTGTQTIRYEGASDQTPSPNTQNTTFTKSETIDKVTGDVISSTNWTPSEHTFGTVKTPVVEGYHADQAQAGGFTSTPQNPNKTIVVTYSPNGKIIPVDKDGNPIPNAPTPQFPTNPDNPTTTTDGKIPSVPGYTPESGQPGDPVKPGTNPGDDVKVPYVKNPTVVATTGTVTYYDETDKKVLSTHDLEGNVGEKITYTTTDMIIQYENQGYKFVDSTFNNGNEVFKRDAADNDFIVNFVHDTQTVTPENPGTPGQPINPNEPNGPKWPESSGKDALEMAGSQTIHYEGAGADTPKDDVQNTTFTKTETIDKVTGDIISSTDWTPSAHTFGSVKTPVIKGYHADQAEAGGFKATPQDPKKTIVVTYSPNGKIIPVTPDGNPIPNVPNPPYTTNPDNPTTVNPNEPVPEIPGYTPEKNTVTPENPGTDTPVVYHKNETPTPETGSVTVTFRDDTTNTTIPDVGYQSGEEDVGTAINYNPDSTIKDLENKGYKLVPGQDTNIPKEITKGAKTIVIHMVHGTTTITPDKPGEPGEPINPNDPNGPKWPDDTSKNALEMTGSQTIHYEGAGADTPKDNVQNTTFTRTATVDNVTGKIISTTDWTPSDHTFGTVKTPVIKGYHADQAQAGGFGATPQDPNKTITITYSPNGKIVPVTPDGNPIPNVPNPPYTTNPDNPTSVTPNEPVPQIPGYTPEKSTVTPENPGTDTKVIYTPSTPTVPDTPNVPSTPDVTTIQGKQTIEFVDGSGQQLQPSNVQTHTFTLTNGVSNESSYTFGSITVPVIKGYVAQVTTAGGKMVTPQDPDATVIVVYHKIGKIVPITPDGKEIPGAPTPQYQNDPNDPTKVEPNETVPTISGYTPNESSITPIDPTKDTQVIYTKNDESTPDNDNNEPDEPDEEPDEEDDNTPEPSKPSKHHKSHQSRINSRPPKPANGYNTNIGPHSQSGYWNNNIGPHATTVKSWTNNVGPHGETVNVNGQIIGPHGQVLGYVDANGNPHYYNLSGRSGINKNASRKLPATSESNQDIADAILAGLAVSMSLIGLAGVKRRKHE